MSLDTLQVSTSNSADQASGLIRHEADETSSTIAELASMFPSLDYDVVVNVLEAHSGRIQAAVDYLMSANGGGVQEDRFSGGVGGYYSLLDPPPAAEEDAVAGQFSKDIGGLPIVLPTPLYDEEDSNGGRGTSRQSRSSEGSAGEGTRASTRDVAVRCESPPSSQQLTQASDSDPLLVDDNDPLPTYQEACRQQQQPPSLSGITPAGREPTASRATGIRIVLPPTEEQLQAKSGHGNKKKGNKSPKSPKSPKRQKKSGSKHRGKAVQEKSGDQYQRLIDDDEDEPEL